MSEKIQVSKNIFVDLNDYIPEAREKIKSDLQNLPTHDYCNSECSDCYTRRYCRWTPWNIGVMKGRRDPRFNYERGSVKKQLPV